ncbi:Rrf2 family transcriptional regulator [Lysobacter sp. 5GHs7-4]|uniref:RrF2 family transcriptional regulator n=1 Tax=Lysobacter sp. 5GHs7-4 TaxID=2904253 RepID=UPI001E5D9696|nr:Rrf2 family transcriptional regulator [Lysobacter sp. 5GHs7-4]UHQ24671.1 Rrf2 family transcriptional regulator [Lysobacter sp. 5GHs7-4]
MRNDNRLSRMLHVLIHMAQHPGPITSELIASILSTNAVVVRRTMAGLREQGYVQSVKGHGGGWSLAQPLDKISLLDVYRAIGEPPVFALGLSDDHPRCLVEQGVNAALRGALEEAREQLLSRFATTTLDAIARDYEARMQGRKAPRPWWER